MLEHENKAQYLKVAAMPCNKINFEFSTFLNFKMVVSLIKVQIMLFMLRLISPFRLLQDSLPVQKWVLVIKLYSYCVMFCLNTLKVKLSTVMMSSRTLFHCTVFNSGPD